MGGRELGGWKEKGGREMSSGASRGASFAARLSKSFVKAVETT